MAGDSPHFKVGDQVRYLLPAEPAKGIVFREIPATVIGVSSSRVVIQVAGYARPISVRKTSVARRDDAR